MYSQFRFEIRQLSWKKFINLIKDQIEFDKTFDEEIYVLLLNLRQVNLISSFRIVNLIS